MTHPQTTVESNRDRPGVTGQRARRETPWGVAGSPGQFRRSSSPDIDRENIELVRPVDGSLDRQNSRGCASGDGCSGTLYF